jgi:hypothetical protein
MLINNHILLKNLQAGWLGDFYFALEYAFFASFFIEVITLYTKLQPFL